MTTQQHIVGLDWDLQDRLHKAMRYAGLSTSELAEKIGVHRNTIANNLSGRTPVARRTLIAWALACGVPVGWLETGEVPTTSDPDDGLGLDTPRTFGWFQPLVDQDDYALTA